MTERGSNVYNSLLKALASLTPRQTRNFWHELTTLENSPHSNGWIIPMMTITIEVPPDDGANVMVHTVVRGLSREQVKPYLRRAITALQAELDAFDECPWQRGGR